jgi:hypothetical protein
MPVKDRRKPVPMELLRAGMTWQGVIAVILTVSLAVGFISNVFYSLQTGKEISSGFNASVLPVIAAILGAACNNIVNMITSPHRDKADNEELAENIGQAVVEASKEEPVSTVSEGNVAEKAIEEEEKSDG